MDAVGLAGFYYNRSLKASKTKQFGEAEYASKDVDKVALKDHLKWMCERIIHRRVEGAKAMRWIGYIQGEMRGLGMFSVTELRDQSRESGLVEYVAGFAFHHSEARFISVALVKKAKPTWQAGKLNGVGGKVEVSLRETAHEAMTREFKEETGVETDEKDWNAFAKLYSKGGLIHFFRTTAPELWRVKGTDEEPVFWWGVNNVLANSETIPNLKWLIPMALHQPVLEPVEVHE